MDFKEASDKLMEFGVKLEDMAAGFRVELNTVARWRMEPEKKGSRSPPKPERWGPVLRRVAADRQIELGELADLFPAGPAK